MKTQMAVNPQLTKDWIQYLKNNRIVAMQSDPKTGLLNYKRPATTADLKKFLSSTGQFDDEAIEKAIASISGEQQPQQPQPQKKPGDRKVSMRSRGAKAFKNMAKQLGESQQPSFKQIYEEISDLGSVGAKRAATHQKQDVARNYGASVKGGDYSDKIKKEPEQKKPEQPPQDNIFKDEKGTEIHEKDVEKVFSMLGKGKQPGLAGDKQGVEQGQRKEDPEKEQAKKIEEMNKIKHIIRDTMTPQQRKSLYRALSDTELSEALVNKADIKHIFQTAADLKNKSWKSRLLRKDKIGVNDLQQVWKQEGFPDDTRDIARILKDQGFGDEEIKKAMSKTFGPSDDKDGKMAEPVASPAIQKIADIARERGYAEDIKRFMEKEFKDDLGVSSDWAYNLGKATGGLVRGITGKKATTEDIRQVFEYIVLEERKERTKLIKEQEQTNLGRNKKISIIEQDLDVGDVLKPNQVVDLLKSLKLKIDPGIEVDTVGNQIIQSWKKGLKSRKHFDNLLSAVHLKISDLINE
jgi:hypothetical protein